jgi:hypothetical protein
VPGIGDKIPAGLFDPPLLGKVGDDEKHPRRRLPGGYSKASSVKLGQVEHPAFLSPFQGGEDEAVHFTGRKHPLHRGSGGHVSPHGKQPGGDPVHVPDPSAVIKQNDPHRKGRDDPGEVLPFGPEFLHGAPELGGHAVQGAGKPLQFRFGHEGEADFLSLGNFAR